jgi:hypothetical protein
MALLLNTLSLALLALAATSYVRRRFAILCGAALLFFPVTAAATVLTWWPLSPALAVAILALTLGVSLCALALFGIDVAWAPFCLEMTYLTFLCWTLFPLAVLLNFLGLALCALLGIPPS